MNAHLLDTGVIVGLLDSREQFHQQCVEAVNSSDVPLLTCEPVVAEACYLLRHLHGAVDRILENVERGEFLVTTQLSLRVRNIRRLIKKYADTPMDFADACLVDLAGEVKSGRILTLDSDFQVYRWGRNRPFDLLINLD
ncbi:MAG: type II toxin-antitoxin system VapC family toxin [Aeoliella sp.]